MDLMKFLKFKVNGMEAPRYLASKLLMDKSYSGKKYYEMEDKYTNRIIDKINNLYKYADVKDTKEIANGFLAIALVSYVKSHHISFNKDWEITKNTLLELG